MIEDLITGIRELIEEEGIKCFSPDLPQGKDICSALRVQQGTNIRSLNSLLYSKIPCYILIRGNTNDKETRQISQRIFNKLDNVTDYSYNKSKIIQILCDTPNYAFRDENQNIYYNINIQVQIESE